MHACINFELFWRQQSMKMTFIVEPRLNNINKQHLFHAQIIVGKYEEWPLAL